jgi:hypothetical protein
MLKMSIGFIHWPFIFECQEHTARGSKSNVWRADLPHYVRPDSRADPARIRLPTHTVRGSGAAPEGLFVEGIHDCQHFHRDDMEFGKRDDL